MIADESSKSGTRRLTEIESYLERRNIKTGLTSVLLAHRALHRGIEVYPDEKRRLTMDVKNTPIWFDGARSNINGLLARRCTRFKDVTSKLLSNFGIPTTTNLAFAAQDVEAAWVWADAHLPVVVKPPNDGMGASVHVGITDRSTFMSAFADVATSSPTVLVEEFVEGIEHRVTLVYGKVAAAARRIPAHVVGDGVSSIRKLIDAKNLERVESANPVHFQIPIDPIVVRHLAEQGFTEETVPPQDHHVWLRANSNVHSGGDGVDATDELRPEEIKIAEQVAQAIPGLRLAGLDLLLPRDGNGTTARVLEVNGTPMITGHHYPWYGQSRDVAGFLVDSMFPPTGNEEIVPVKTRVFPVWPVVKRRIRNAVGR